MVNNQNPYLSKLPDLPHPPSIDDPDKDDRRIGNAPIWSLKELVSIAGRHSEDRVSLRMVTDKSERDYENLLENGFDLQEVLSKLEVEGRYKGTWWCKTSPTKDRNGQPRGKGSWVPCDAYDITCEYEHPKTGYRGKANYYLKMCESIDGSVVLFVSLHG